MNRLFAHTPLLDSLRRSVHGLFRAPERQSPEASPPRADAAPAEAVAGPPAAPRALVVEPQDAARTSLATALTTSGFAVSVAPDRERALRCMSEDVDGFDLILAGPGASRCEGDLLVRTVRRGGEADLAIVVVTAGADPGRDAERAGADAVLDGSLGAELIARASEAVLARKRDTAPDQ
jgi:DNA-binding response OmpR family regulator